jgi:hypothetical protein
MIINTEKSPTMEPSSYSSEEKKPAQIPQNQEIGRDQSDGQQQSGAKDAEPELPFSIYGSREKKFIVLMASLAALLSPLSANIYYPALNTLADELRVSLTLINLTITAYLVSEVDIRLTSVSSNYNADCYADIPRNSPNLYWNDIR